ncbi:MAG: LysR family transcriptional regulator [Rhizomicrobium sp.]
MDRLDAMSVLLTVVKTGSFSAASRKLGVPVATVSRNISELEEHLKTRVLIRSSRQMSLTDAGRSYVEACKLILEKVEEAERAAAGEYAEPKGDLAVTSPEVFGRLHLLPVALEFMAAYPDINLRFILSDRKVDLLAENVDLAIRIGHLSDSSLIATRIGAIRIVICGSPRYLAARGRPSRPEDLSEHDCVTFDSLASPSAWKFVNAEGETLVPVRSRLTADSAEAAIGAAVAGIGLLRMHSYKVVEAKQAGTLELLLEKFEPEPWPVNLVYPGQGALPLKLRAFLDFATPRLKARLSDVASRLG